MYAKLPFGLVLFFAVFAVAPSAWAQEKVQAHLDCVDSGSQDSLEKLADRENHAISVEYYTCVEEDGLEKGAIATGHNIIEWDGAIGTILSGDGVTRLAGPTEVYKALDGKITLTFKDGKVVDAHAEGHNQILIATGVAAPLSGKTNTWTSKVVGPGHFSIDVTIP
jgi:hypothetical protein